MGAHQAYRQNVIGINPKVTTKSHWVHALRQDVNNVYFCPFSNWQVLSHTAPVIEAYKNKSILLLVRINLSCSSKKTICPTLSSRLTGAPCSKRTLIQSKFPRTAAQCKGVSPSYNKQNKTNRSVYKKCVRDRGEGSTSQLQISSLCASSTDTHTPLRW